MGVSIRPTAVSTQIIYASDFLLPYGSFTALILPFQRKVLYANFLLPYGSFAGVGNGNGVGGRVFLLPYGSFRAIRLTTMTFF